MDTLNEIFADWTIIDTPKRLRGAILHASRLLTRQDNIALASKFFANAKCVPQKMEKESINYVLFVICVEPGIIK